MVNITFPETKTVIDAIRGAIGRNITFVLNDITNCTSCSLDPVSGGSTDPFCTECNGKYYISVDRNVDVLSHVTNGKVDQLGWVSGGQFNEGDCRAQLDYTADNISYIESASKIIVDGKEYRIRNKEFRGVPQINRIILYLQQED